MVLAVAAVGMASRCAAGTIDQQNLVGGADNPASTTFGESFTPTLTSIGYAEFDLSTAGSTLQLSLYNGTGSSCTLLGQSASDAIGTASFGIVHFDLLSSVTLTPGNSYTLLVSDSTGTFEGTYNPGNPYAGGELFAPFGIPPADAMFTEGPSDTSTPEPSSFLLLAFGGLVLGFHFRARRHRDYQFVIDPSGRK